MTSQPEIMEYDSVDDLENKIDQVYERVDRLNEEMGTLLGQVGAFLQYEHDMDEFHSAAEYVSKNIVDEALPGIAVEYAHKELDDPEEASNWDKLEEAQNKAEHVGDQWRTAYENLWSEFGYDDDTLRREVEGIPPFQHFLNTWEEAPHKLFAAQESYDSLEEKLGQSHMPTMARYFDIEEPTAKQFDDQIREKQLENDEEREELGSSFEESPSSKRNRLEDRTGFSDWINQEKVEEEKDKTV